MSEYPTPNKIETVCFTGHRHIERSRAVLIPSKLKPMLEKLILGGTTHFRAGGALGFDTVAALCVLELKEKYPHICLDLILPCRNQTEMWDEGTTAVYRHILSLASSVEYVADKFIPGCMHERNRRLVNGSQLCIAYMERSEGGTAYTFAYALENGVEVVNLVTD